MAEILTARKIERLRDPDREFVGFSHGELSTLSNALTVAAHEFDKHAKVAKEARQPFLAEQFERQAEDSRKLWDSLN